LSFFQLFEPYNFGTLCCLDTETYSVFDGITYRRNTVQSLDLVEAVTYLFRTTVYGTVWNLSQND